VNVSPGPTTWLKVAPPLSDVTVWLTPSLLVQRTESPTVTVIELGL
jgi:hypothetical protein